MAFPVFHVPGLEQPVDQLDEAAIVDVSPDDVQQDRMIDVVERLSNMMPPSRTRLPSIPK